MATALMGERCSRKPKRPERESTAVLAVGRLVKAREPDEDLTAPRPGEIQASAPAERNRTAAAARDRFREGGAMVLMWGPFGTIDRAVAVIALWEPEWRWRFDRR